MEFNVGVVNIRPCYKFLLLANIHLKHHVLILDEGIEWLNFNARLSFCTNTEPACYWARIGPVPLKSISKKNEMS